VTDMNSMFYKASVFNQPIGNWNTAAVTNMNAMFYYASAFSNQDLSSWNVNNVHGNHSNFFTGAGAGNIEPLWVP